MIIEVGVRDQCEKYAVSQYNCTGALNCSSDKHWRVVRPFDYSSVLYCIDCWSLEVPQYRHCDVPPRRSVGWIRGGSYDVIGYCDLRRSVWILCRQCGDGSHGNAIGTFLNSRILCNKIQNNVFHCIEWNMPYLSFTRNFFSCSIPSIYYMGSYLIYYV